MNLKSNSRENQDLFVLYVLNKKNNGTYIEIGANHPIIDSNTFLLEKEFNWKGLSFEIDVTLVNTFNVIRTNPCILADATVIDYNQLFEFCNTPKHIDFLQLDIDPHENTLKALNKIDLSKYEFSIITYEHDFYRGGEKEREESRKILDNYGYTRVISDVMHDDFIFEDWYINEKYMPNDNWKNFIGEKINMNTEKLSQKHKDIFNQL